MASRASHDRAVAADAAEPKVSALRASIPDADNLRIWRQVEKTDPAHTKRVNQRGGFTAISAHYQVMRATEVFGPVGVGWGYINGEPIWHETLCIVPVTLWHGNRENTFGPVYGGAEWRNPKGYLDSDAPKKAATDGLTKALSQLGFNADVFMGRFDDNKYVQQMAQEFAANDPANDAAGGHSQREKGAVSPRQQPSNGDGTGHREKLAGPYTSISQLKTAVREFVRTMQGCGDADELRAFLDTKDAVELIAQVKRDMAQWWDGGTDMPAEFVPLHRQIEMKEYEMAQQIADIARA